MHHAMTWNTQPSQVWNFVDFVQWKLVVDVMTMHLKRIEQRSATTLAFTSISIKGIFSIHEILEIDFPAFTTGIYR